MEEIIEQINAALDKIRPFIQKDGGDVELVEYRDGVVVIRMHGACQGCALLDDTVSNGIEAILKEEVPGVTKVEVAL